MKKSAILKTPEDRQMCLLLEPDEWEKQDTELLLTSKDVRQKVNPMLGIIVQHSFYDDEIAKARQNPEKMNEVICKLLNVYQGMRVTKWLTGDQIRPRQVERRITDCKYADGWNIFVGLDFGGNDDLWAVSMLGVNYRHDVKPEDRYFADTMAWITEKALQESPNRQLYELWVEQGWLKVCPGEVFNPDYPVNELMSLNLQGLNMYMFGYDPAQSLQPINTIKAWLQSLGIPAETIKRMVVPVPQTFVAMNGVIQQIEWLLLAQSMDTETGRWSYSGDMPLLYLSNSPLWPWCFGNCKLEISNSELRHVRKSTPAQKIDPVHALLDALYLFDLSEGRIEQ